MKPIHHVTRHELVMAELDSARRFTDGQSTRAFRRKAERGWTTAMPAEGPPFEEVAFVHAHNRLIGLVDRVRKGEDWFDEDQLDAELGGPWSSDRGLVQLSKVGLALVAYAEGRVRLKAADPRAARYVNAVRRGPSKKGYKIQGLIEAFLPVRDPRRSHLKVTDDRRLALATVLDECWAIDAEDLFTNRQRVRLVPRWTIPTLMEA